MKQNKLLELLKTCTSKERNALDDFVQSPYFVKDEATTRLIRYLLKHFKAMPEDKEQLFAIAYPKEKYVDKKYRYLISDSAKLVTRFWLIQSYEKNAPQQLLDQMKIYSRRDLEKGYQQTKRGWQKSGYAQRSSDFMSYWYQLQFEEISSSHFHRNRTRQLDEDIERVVTNLDQYYYLYRLANACDMLNKEAVLQKKYKIKLTPDWFVYLQEQSFFGDILIESYWWMWNILNEPEEESYFQPFLNKIQLLGNSTDIAIVKMFYRAAINYAIRKIRAGKLEYQAIALKIYVETINEKILLDNNQLSPWVFGNVVKLALKVKDPTWVEQFINEKAELLPPATYQNALNYNLAELKYVTKNYEVAQQKLAMVELSDLNYYLGARILLSKIYFENDEIEPLLSLINAFNIFLKRNKEISEGIKQSCLNFCQILYQLVRQNEKRMAGMQEEITNMGLLVQRDWLLQQHQELMKK